MFSGKTKRRILRSSGRCLVPPPDWLGTTQVSGQWGFSISLLTLCGQWRGQKISTKGPLRHVADRCPQTQALLWFLKHCVAVGWPCISCDFGLRKTSNCHKSLEENMLFMPTLVMTIVYLHWYAFFFYFWERELFPPTASSRYAKPRQLALVSYLHSKVKHKSENKWAYFLKTPIILSISKIYLDIIKKKICDTTRLGDWNTHISASNTTAVRVKHNLFSPFIPLPNPSVPLDWPEQLSQ